VNDFSVAKACASLTSKGFTEKKRRDHHCFFFWNKGKKTRIHTKCSHGRIIGLKDLRSMQKQVRLSNIDALERLLDCSMKEVEYAAILRDQGLIE
jgi:predicted RNA binding protein YcfA (HicA-like mRNA interferase family)